MTIWITTSIYLLWLFVYYRKNRTDIKSNISLNTTPPQGLTLLQAGYILKEEELSYQAQSQFLLQEGYLELAKEKKPYHTYQKTKKSRATLDEYEKFFINKILFPKVEHRSTRDGGQAPYAIHLSQDKHTLQEMLNNWATEEQYINPKKQNSYQKLFWTLFGLLGALYLFFVYLFLAEKFGSSELLTTAISLIVLFLALLMGVYFVLNLLKKIVKRNLLSTHNTILLAVALGLIGTNVFLMQKLPSLSILHNPFIALSMALFFTIATYLYLDFFTPKGAELKEVLLSYKAHLQKFPKEQKTLPNFYEVLFG